MKYEDAIMESREKQAFWSGVVRGAIGAAAFLAGLVTVVYYVVQITVVLK